MALIETRDLHKIYDVGESPVHALDGVSVTIERGEFVAIMGPSGSGKSTFMNVIGCLDQQTRGQYLLDGIDVSHRDRDELAAIRNAKIGFVFQGFNLLPRTSALENVELPLLYNNISGAERRKKALASLKALGLEGREHHNPNQLSGGQQQRVAIARALVNDAPLVLADEPTGNLDSQTGEDVLRYLFDLVREQNLTLVIVTHNEAVAARCARHLVLRDGQL